MPVGRAAVALAFTVATIAVPAAAVPTAHAGVPVIAIDGRGSGHGVGMAQDGALQMGRQGDSLGQILGQFYPGTSIGRVTGDVRVPVLDAGAAPAAAEVDFPDGGTIAANPTGQGQSTPVPAGSSAVFRWDGSTYTATVQTRPGETTTTGAPTTTSTTAKPTTTTTKPATPALPTLPGHHAGTVRVVGAEMAGAADTAGAGAESSAPAASSQPLWAIPSDGGVVAVPGRGRSYRGVIEAIGATSLRLVNQVDVESYLIGMGEVRNPSWPLASLEAQEVAARTYAMRAMAIGGELCDDTRCQVYLGADAEYPLARQAVQATRGEVLESNGGLVDAVYSANAAGFTASREEGFGLTDNAYPYLRPAPYPTSDPMQWSVQVGTADVAAAFGLTGELTNIAVTDKGPSGRALAVTLTAGVAPHQTTKVVSGLAFAAGLGLRSTMIDAIRPGVAATAPPKPGPSTLQVPPDQAAAVAGAPAETAEAAPAAPRAVIGDAAMDPFATGPLPASHRTGAPLALVLLAAGLVGLTGAAAYRSSPRKRSV